ncbi:MAG: toll/interleukin-1 receptor domain-containing protein, partial [Caulobacterales bacterium]|nr:toll/interleukin-1 receptor domain-containing protein [Caulobacterales bacterium]
MSGIFLSFSVDDVDIVRPIAVALRRDGWDVRLGPHDDRDDRVDLPAIPDEPYHAAIDRQLSGAACVLVFWSSNGVTCPWVRAEASVARAKGKLLEVRLDDASPPFDDARPLDFSHWTAGADDAAWREL